MNRIMVLMALFCAATPDFAQKVRVDYAHHGNFSRYKTYRWVQTSAQPAPDMPFPNQLMQERIVAFVDQAMAARCLKRVNSGGDLLLSFQLNVTAQEQFTTVGDGWGGGWGWGWGSGVAVTTPQVFYTGTLILDFVDSQQKQLVFQGVSKQSISSRPEHNTRRLARAVNKIFEKYPPGT